MDLSEYKKYVCLPLDVDTSDEALKIVDELNEYVGCFKIGMQLFTSSGPELVKTIIKKECKVFLDLKYHDIPITVEKAIIEAGKLGVSYITIHLSGGSEMIKAASDAANKMPEESRPIILGVTVLTSISKSQLSEELSVSKELLDHVNGLIDLGIKNGLHGIVCSPTDLEFVHDKHKQIYFVTPGIRPLWSEKNDQKRISTPSNAIKNGSSLLVIGRPILSAENRKTAAIKVLEEIKECLKQK